MPREAFYDDCVCHQGLYERTAANTDHATGMTFALGATAIGSALIYGVIEGVKLVVSGLSAIGEAAARVPLYVYPLAIFLSIVILFSLLFVVGEIALIAGGNQSNTGRAFAWLKERIRMRLMFRELWKARHHPLFSRSAQEIVEAGEDHHEEKITFSPEMLEMYYEVLTRTQEKAGLEVEYNPVEGRKFAETVLASV